MLRRLRITGRYLSSGIEREPEYPSGLSTAKLVRAAVGSMQTLPSLPDVRNLC